MNSIEQAIRTALAKGDASDQAFRRRIYGSASAAFERSIAGRDYSETEIKSRKQGLLTTIKNIESEFIVAVEQSAPTEVAREQSYRIQKVKSDRDAFSSAGAIVGRQKDASFQRINVAMARNPRPRLKYAFNAFFLLAIILGGIWAYSAAKQMYLEATTSKSNGPKPALSEAASVTAGENADWVQIFTARDTDLVSAAAGTKAEITSRDGANFVTISGPEVSIKIGAGLMQTFAGKRVLFNIKARSVNGATLDAGAHCNFGAETKCERKRFKVGAQSAEYMFAVSVAASASGDGALLIAPDLTGDGGAVEIENIRATIIHADAG